MQWVALSSEGLGSLLVILGIVTLYASVFAFTRSPRWAWATTAVGALSMFGLLVAAQVGG
jgi:hypothetical protein